MSWNIKKTYPIWYSSFRRKWANLFRPMSHFSILQPIVILMFAIFLLSLILFLFDNDGYPIPFLIGWVFVYISFHYFSAFPLTWGEMTDEEKDYYRTTHKFPDDWQP